MESRSESLADYTGGLQLSESVASHLREQIFSGKLAKGEFLRIEAIARALGISTTPVREGLLKLQSESFVRLLPRRGFVVNSFSKDDVRDIFWAQATVGAELAARAALMMPADEVDRLEALEDEHRAAIAANEGARVTRLGHAFHRQINLAAQSPRLALLQGSLVKQLPNRFYTRIEGQLNEAVESHPVIIAAIRARDANAARASMYSHVLSGGEHLISMLDRQNAWDAGQEPGNVLSIQFK